MAGSGREARRRRIIQGSQDRLALITGRRPNLPSDPNDSDSSPPFVSNNDNNQDLQSFLPPDQPTVSPIAEDRPTTFMSSSHDQATRSNTEDLLVRRPEVVTGPSRAPPPTATTEDRTRREPPSEVHKAMLTASDAVQRLTQQLPIANVTSQQVNIAVGETEHDRMLCALIMAILVVLSYAGFPIVGSRVFRWFILFRPLFLVLIANITLVVRRIPPDNQRNLVRGDTKDENKSLLGDEYAWAEEAGRALEMGLMLQKVMSALLMDCSVYVTIVVFGLSLFG